MDTLPTRQADGELAEFINDLADEPTPFVERLNYGGYFSEWRAASARAQGDE